MIYSLKREIQVDIILETRNDIKAEDKVPVVQSE